MPDIKQPELPEPAFISEGKFGKVVLWSADQMHAHYAKGHEAGREEIILHARDFNTWEEYEFGFDEAYNESGREGEIVRKAYAAGCAAALKQSLAHPTKEPEDNGLLEEICPFDLSGLTIKKDEAQVYEPCQGMKCGCTDGKSHSVECLAESAASFAGGRFAKGYEQQPAQAAVPEGWQLVPKKITTVMQREGVCNPAQWRSLLLHAPAAPEREGGV